MPGVSAPEVLRDAPRWHPAGAGDALVVPLPPLFAEAHGER